MIVKLSLSPEVESGLMARARARGVSLDNYLEELVAREAGLAASLPTSGEEKARAFVQWASGHRDTPPLSDEDISRATMYPDRW
jgi:predicted nucleic acid-binding protein